MRIMTEMVQAVNRQVERYATYLYNKEKAAIEYLAIEHPHKEDYRVVLNSILVEKVSIKNEQYRKGKYNVTEHLIDLLYHRIFSHIDENNKGELNEYPQFRMLRDWYNEDKLVVFDAPELRSKDIFKVIARVKTGSTIDFVFPILREDFEKAARLLADSMLIEEISEKLRLETATNNNAHKGLGIKNNNRSSGKKDSKNIEKLAWNGSRDILEKIFLKLSKSELEESHKNFIEATPEQIENFIDGYFFCLGDIANERKAENLELLFNGHLSPLVRLFYYLSKVKSKNAAKIKNKDVVLLSAAWDDLYKFLGTAFINNNNGQTTPVNISSVERIWCETHKIYEGNLTLLIEDEKKPHKKKSSVILLIKDLIPK